MAATVASLVAIAVVASTGMTSQADDVAAADQPLASGRTGGSVGTVTAATGKRTGSVEPEAPVGARLPSGKLVPAVPADTTDDGTLDVPEDITVSGWWRGSSRLGDPFGSMLLAAHVDSTTQGLGPYAELLSVSAGARITITSRTLEQDYEVRSLQLIKKGTVPAHRWISSPRGPHRLTLVTCAGPYDPTKGGYQRLAVVTATPLGRPTPRG